MKIKLVKQRFLKENMDIDVQLENFDEDTRLVRHGNDERLLSKCFNCVNLNS